MGGKCPHRKVKKRRLSHKSARRTKFLHKDILYLFFLSLFTLLLSNHRISSVFFFFLFFLCFVFFVIDFKIVSLSRFFLTNLHATMLFTRSFRRVQRRMGRLILCPSTKISLAWASSTVCTASMSSPTCLQFSTLRLQFLESDFVFPSFCNFIFSHFSRYFANVSVRDQHFQTKKHKKRCMSHPFFFFCSMRSLLEIGYLQANLLSLTRYL